MAIRYDPPLIAALVAEISWRWEGCRVSGVWLDQDGRTARLGFASRDGEAETLVLLLHPAAGQLIVDASPAPVAGRGTWHPFRRLCLSRVAAPGDERLLVLELAGGRRDVHVDLPPVFRLFVELHTNQWNAVLARGDNDRIEAVLWPRTAGGRRLRSGDRYAFPEGPRDWIDRPPTLAEWRGLLAGVAPGSRRSALLGSVAWTSSINVNWVLGPAAHDPDPGLLESSLDRYLELRREGYREAWLLERQTGAGQPYPMQLAPTARRCEDMLQAMRVSAEQIGVWPPAGSGESAADSPTPRAVPDDAADAAALEAELGRRVRRVVRKRAALERQLDGENADRLRDLGHLLLARQADVPRGVERISLEGFDGATVELELDPRLDAVRNAERFYEQAKRREKAAAGLPVRIRDAEARLTELEAALEALRTGGPTDELWEQAGGRPSDRAGSVTGRPSDRVGRDALPYRRFRSSGGLEIRVGRSARDNDDLTFRHSAPEDVWLHARHAAGAHVILRWDRRDQAPPQADLAEAAALAAVHSEARHSGLVAVDWTRRKYVRKARKAGPGTVIPERVSTLFVEPDSSVVRRLSTED